jgi:hypothetical protein
MNGAEAVFRRVAEQEPGLNTNLKAVRQLAAVGKGDVLLKVGIQFLGLGNQKRNRCKCDAIAEALGVTGRTHGSPYLVAVLSG